MPTVPSVTLAILSPSNRTLLQGRFSLARFLLVCLFLSTSQLDWKGQEKKILLLAVIPDLSLMTTRVLVQACPKYLILGLCVCTSLVGHEDFLKASQRSPSFLIRKKREEEKKAGWRWRRGTQISSRNLKLLTVVHTRPSSSWGP